MTLGFSLPTDARYSRKMREFHAPKENILRVSGAHGPRLGSRGPLAVV